MSNQIKIKKLRPDAWLPRYAHPGEDAAFDLMAVQAFRLEIGVPLSTPIGIAVEFPEEHFAHVMCRSGLAKQGVSILGGVIDWGYRGEWHVQMVNHGLEAINFYPGDRIAQCAIIPVPTLSIVEVSELSESQRGTNGLGSTGMQAVKGGQ